MITVDGSRTRLTTRQLWVLLAVARGRVDRDPMYGGICTLDGHSVSWTMTVLAVRGLIAFDPILPSPPQLTRRGDAVLGTLTPPLRSAGS